MRTRHVTTFAKGYTKNINNTQVIVYQGHMFYTLAVLQRRPGGRPGRVGRGSAVYQGQVRAGEAPLRAARPPPPRGTLSLSLHLEHCNTARRTNGPTGRA